ncbi:hypothetical protein RI129_007120 [Pyrocoelia pectoralis]|uniref:DDE Tnp4 domain-containing protein n=1 Tax=Pyrocoelia pectoralis TaxID=417401 RepID=A0AAN7V7G5_9COLE
MKTELLLVYIHKIMRCNSNNPNIKTKVKKLLTLYVLLKKKENKKKVPSNRKFWVRRIFEENNRLLQGCSSNLIVEIEDNDPDKYFNFLRMSPDSFHELLEYVKARIEKRNVVRTPIPATTRLQVTLRYLASGDSMTSISFLFRIGINSVSRIILETCSAIWDCLKDIVLRVPSEQIWKEYADTFQTKWNFPHCIGAVDGKHVVIEAPPRSGSVYYNYKNSHSICLFAIADADLCFILVDIGAPGRQSDSGIFRSSVMGRKLESGSLHVPNPSVLDGNIMQELNLPYVLVGDEAFALSHFLMRPYPRRSNLDRRKKIFNYRLSRARRVVESAFGILSGRWRIYRRPINASIDTTIKIVQATVCLHNFLMKDKTNVDRARYSIEDCLGEESLGLVDSGRTGSNTYSTRASMIRETFATYFEGPGAVPWQWEKVLRNEY